MNWKTWLVVWFIVSQALDGWSTAYALNRGFREGNPLLPSSVRGIVLTKAVAVPLLVYPLHRASTRKAGRWLLVIVNAATTAFVVNNVRMARGKR